MRIGYIWCFVKAWSAMYGLWRIKVLRSMRLKERTEILAFVWLSGTAPSAFC